MKSLPRRLYTVALLAVAGLSLSARNVPRQQAGPPNPPEPPFALLTSPDDFVHLCLADARLLGPDEAYFTRWLSIGDSDIRSVKTSSLALNYDSRASTVRRPLPLFGNRLVRVDLRWFFPQYADLKEALDLWEQLGNDPTFALLLTHDTLRFLEGDRVSNLAHAGGWRTEERVIDHPAGDYPYPDDTGRVWRGAPAGKHTFTLRFRERKDLPDVVRLDPGHLDPAAYAELRALTGSCAPVVDHRYFKWRALHSIRDKGVYREVFGGLYYQLAGIKRAADVFGKGTKVRDIDLFFNNLGIGSLKGAENFREFFDRLRSDQRAVIRRSDVTGKWRVGFFLRDPGDHDGNAWGSITLDPQDDQIDIGDLPVANLLDPQGVAQEAIFPKTNGTNLFALFKVVDGSLQDEVPPQVAAARNRPAPHTTRLNAAEDCLECHYAGGHDGWIPFGNDVKRLLAGWPRDKAGAGRLDIFGDLSARKNAFSPDTFDRLAGLYEGDFSKHIRRARDDVAEVTLRCTGPWEESTEAQADVAKIAHQRLKEEQDGYYYKLVDAAQALRECGYQVPPSRAVEVLNRLCPPDGRSELVLPYVGRAIPEDPRIGDLKDSAAIPRADFALCFAFLCERVQKSARANVAAGLTWWGDPPGRN